MTTGLVAVLADPYSFTVFTVAFSPDGRMLAAGQNQGSTYLWNVATGDLIATLNDSGGSGVTSVAFSPGGHTLVASGADGIIYMWDLATRHLFVTHTDPGSLGVYSVAFSSNGRMLAAASAVGATITGSVYNFQTGQSSGNKAAGILANISNIIAPFATKELTESSEGLSDVIKLIVDMAGNVGAAVAIGT